MFPLLYDFTGCTVSSAFPYSCLLFRMFNAYAETGLFVFMYLVFSRCHIPIELPVWPACDSIHVLHFNLYIPLEFISFSGIFSRIWLYNVLLIRKAILNLVFLNKLETLCTSVLGNLKVTNFFCCCLCVGATFFFGGGEVKYFVLYLVNNL